MISREKRRYPRVSVSSQALASITERLLTVNEEEGKEGEGIVKNLSQGGCQIATPLTVKQGCVLSLILQLAPLAEPLNIETARVVWSAPPNCGVQFLTLSALDQQRLKRFLAGQP